MRSLSICLFICSLVVTACTTQGPGSSGEDRDLRATADLRGQDQSLEPEDGSGGGEDLAAVSRCSALSACECLADRGCASITEPCFCPHPLCGPGACICGGGAFLGCAPAESNCTSVVSCRPAGRMGAPDAKGCLECKYSSDCATAFKQMMDKLKATPGCGISDTLVEAFSCSRNPACVTKCVNDVSRCEDIGCGLCSRCGCARVGTFEQCVAACLK